MLFGLRESRMLYNELNIYRIVKITYRPGNCIDSHAHEYFHYIYVIKGNPEIIVNDEKYAATPKELYLIAPHTQHEILNRSEQSCETLDIKFNSLNKLVTEQFIQLPVQISNCGHAAESILLTVISSMFENEVLTNDLICIKILELLCILLRSHKRCPNVAGYSIADESIIDIIDNKNTGIFEKVKKYIIENITGKLRIFELSKLFNMSEAYFCTMFKKHYEISPLQYITNLKIEKAIELMYSSSMNMSQISDFLGFESVHYFSRKFKQVIGMSPLNYITEKRGNIIINMSDNEMLRQNQHFQYDQKPIDKQ